MVMEAICRVVDSIIMFFFVNVTSKQAWKGTVGHEK